MRCGVTCLDDVFSRVSGRALKGGYIVVIQTHGRNGQYNPHLHYHCHQWRMGSAGQPVGASRLRAVSHVAQEVAVASAARCCDRRCKTQEMKRLVDACYTRYREGFVTNVQKGDVPARYQSLATVSGQICGESADLAAAHRSL